MHDVGDRFVCFAIIIITITVIIIIIITTIIPVSNNSSPLGRKKSWSEEKQKRKKIHGGKEELKVILLTWEGISTDWKGTDEEKMEGKERETLRNWMINIGWRKSESGY